MSLKIHIKHLFYIEDIFYMCLSSTLLTSSLKHLLCVKHFSPVRYTHVSSLPPSKLMLFLESRSPQFTRPAATVAEVNTRN